MTSRRGFITGLISVVAAPAIVRASSLMPIKPWDDRWIELTIPRWANEVELTSGIHQRVLKFSYDRFTGVWKPVNAEAKALMGEGVKWKLWSEAPQAPPPPEWMKKPMMTMQVPETINNAEMTIELPREVDPMVIEHIFQEAGNGNRT